MTDFTTSLPIFPPFDFAGDIDIPLSLELLMMQENKKKLFEDGAIMAAQLEKLKEEEKELFKDINNKLHISDMARAMEDICSRARVQGESLRILHDELDALKIPPSLMYLEAAVRLELFYAQQSRRLTERRCYDIFREQISTLLPDAIIIDSYKRHQRHAPDFMVALYGELLPVEVKLYNWTPAATRQLSRYLKVYNAERGVACAPNFPRHLPENFIKLSLIVDENSYV